MRHITRRLDAWVALLLMGVSILATFRVAGSGQLFEVFTVNLTLVWVYLLSAILLMGGVLTRDQTAHTVSASLGFFFLVLAVLGILTPSLLDLPLSRGNMWLHFGVGLALLYDWKGTNHLSFRKPRETSPFHDPSHDSSVPGAPGRKT
ncbi:DUF4383 domain-containing protein [Deinococcus cellulosilyticus]|uniref:DUF4383 domain-containing protein n=1 Tax=Deinococcus cellulosilyticus (strain DSM 18568 / NBRC 106333 / KACC 11606 / 5516J-15) TaxID=1223518 RepID=A0A511NAP1_DEIC1|nr:DUF4383 domain-containing protein [Deinococcus cellulosilyticus]GEM49892.1 hypothetical protein DC3_55270 [Deinococcus cellulosilyticus NBRC 106333 = KACC 11606]